MQLYNLTNRMCVHVSAAAAAAAAAAAGGQTRLGLLRVQMT
jgi:hypothetical protein